MEHTTVPQVCGKHTLLPLLATRPHARSAGIACSVCTVDLAPRMGRNVMQCKEVISILVYASAVSQVQRFTVRQRRPEGDLPEVRQDHREEAGAAPAHRSARGTIRRKRASPRAGPASAGAEAARLPLKRRAVRFGRGKAQLPAGGSCAFPVTGTASSWRPREGPDGGGPGGGGPGGGGPHIRFPAGQKDAVSSRPA